MTAQVLVAQPSRTLQTLMRLTLGGEDLVLTLATDGQQALAAALANPPTLVIADTSLSGLDGYALVESLRATERLAEVPVLMLVADHERPDVARLAHLGVTDVIQKPFERHALLERVRGLLGLGAEDEASLGEGDRPAQDQVDGGAAAGYATAQTGDASAAIPTAEQATEALAAMEARVLARLEARLEARLDAVVAAQLPDALGVALEAALTGALAAIAEPQLSAAVDAALARALPEVLEAAAFGVGPAAESALREVAATAVRAALPEALDAVAREVVWSVVPELAEDVIREEIARLTQPEG